MPHHVYTSRGLVLDTHPVRESDKQSIVLTRDLGLVFASARGMRKPGSKLSAALLDLALVRVSLVRGKLSWRITTVTLIRDPARELRGRREALVALARAAALMQKLVRGEEKHPELYDEFEKSVLMLLDEKDVAAEDWEVYTVARLLFHMGYLKQNDAPNTLQDAKENRAKIVKAVNLGMRESGLA